MRFEFSDRPLTGLQCIFTVGCALASLLLSVAFPLLTYSTTLAVFGLAHVASELRFIDQRFGARVGRHFALALGLLLLGVVSTRSVLVFGLAPAGFVYGIELLLVFLLALSALIPASGWSLSSYIVAGCLGFGFFSSPILTVLILAVLHNLTPMGFMVEIVPAKLRKTTFFICGTIYLGLPLIIASGLPGNLLEPFLGIQKNFSILPTGPLDKHLSVYLPSIFHESSWSTQVFSAITFAQCMHYLAVIYVMPRLLRSYMPNDAIKPLLPWPKPAFFWLGVGTLTIGLVALYFSNFNWARSVYGIAAALHAYAEIPILLFAFSGLKNTATNRSQAVSMQH